MPLLNDDGSSIALTLALGPDWRPFHWTAAEGGKELSVLSGGSASGLSSDGRSVLLSPKVVLGTAARLYRADTVTVDTGLQSTPVLLSGEGTAVGLTWTPAGTPNLARWTAAGGLEVLSELDLDARDLLLWGTSADGSVITGGGPRGEEYALFRWSDADGLEFGLPLPAGASRVSFGALSRDGRSIAGHVFDAYGATSVYRWTRATGVVELAPAADFSVVPFINDSFVALSDDGSVVAGSQRNASSPSQAFRWSKQTGVVLLTPGFDSEVHAMNTDGSIIVGMVADDVGSSAGVLLRAAYAPLPIFIWTAESGARNLGLALEQDGVDLSGWSLTPILRFSRDGKVAVGWGSCGGAAVAYRLVLPD